MSQPTLIPNIWDVSELTQQIAWEDYSEQGREGARIHRLYKTADGGPLAAIVQFFPGATAKPHIHPGHENILVLDGGYSDETGEYSTGDLVIYDPDSEHQWKSEQGAILYVVWGKETVLVD